MAPSSSSSSAATSVQVALRIRPPTSQDSTSIPARFQRSVIQATSTTSVSIESPSSASTASGVPNLPTQSGASGSKKQLFTFDQVHPPPTTQYELFDSTARPLVSRFVEGFNCTILAYGQTSSGKTFTMTGVDLDLDPTDPNNGMGIIPRAVSSIFATARQLKEERGNTWTYNIKGSFIEIYNEDLIDLLSMDDPTGAKREVQIREDKEGHIIWGGLREVNVRNPNEVMGLLKKGTSIRRTNETDMNAQSSRSHAIFSLTLTQKKYSGSGPPPRSSSPLPPGRSPSRLARPGSMYAGGPSPIANRVGSPTPGRSSTSSLASAIGRGGGLRPASALGYMGDRSNVVIDEESGDWVTIVSKFHFVDLAGSERLKRTAAAGERIKEGISINSGLLALGNVISALGDPSRAKSNTATHVPYRDSKLTRLLQDSLGGNAHTLMIACVSPAEWNAAETINTLKYANRARNIKNRAVVNEKEDGWDDIEWLQGTVSRLRKELKNIKDGAGISTTDKEPEVLEGAGKRVLAQMSELQSNYEDLREKYVDRTEELTRLRRELGEHHRSGGTSGAVGGTAKYEEIVGPVIEEYEKAISAMEAELSLNRAALRHTNDMVEEREEELAGITERHAATELYVEELRTRVAKLSEREASTEAYVRDLEEKMKAYDETSVSSSESLTDLKRELSRFKDSETQSSKYIADLEARLSKSDESILGLQRTVESLEKECDRRRDEIETLQSRLQTFKQDGESWRSDLEARELRVKQLEEKMKEWEQKKKDAGETRDRLGEVVEEVQHARRSLQLDLANTSPPAVSPTETSGSNPSTAENDTDATSPPSDLENQLLALQQTHTATLADLSSISSKYRDALREISDLAAQIQEVKLNNSSIAEVPSEESPSSEKPQESYGFRRRISSPRVRDAPDLQLNSSGRRLFFRQAASAESLHARSLSQSQSLSQELSSAHLRKASFSSHGTSSSHSPSNSHSFPHTAPTPTMGLKPSLSISTPNLSSQNERSVSSLEKEIMRLQEVLKERETEISLLEESLKEVQTAKQVNGVSPTSQSPVPVEANGIAPGPQPSLEVNGVNPAIELSPQTLNRFEHIRKSMENRFDINEPEDEPLERLNELMLSMAQKEAKHRDTVESLNAELASIRVQLGEMTSLSTNQKVNFAKEAESFEKSRNEDLVLLEEVRQREAQLRKTLEDAESAYEVNINELRSAHEDALKAKALELDELMDAMKLDHEASVLSLQTDLERVTNILETAKQEHETSFGKLKDQHEKELQSKLEEANRVLENARLDHEKALAKVQTEHGAVLRQKDEEAAAALQSTEEEYYNALTKLRGDHHEAIKAVAAETNATIERLREEHAGELRMAEIAKEGTISESESNRALVMAALQEEHTAAISRKEAAFADEIESLNAGFLRTSKAKDDDHTLQMDRLKLEHETVLSKLKSDWRTEVESLNAGLVAEKDEHSDLIRKLRQDNEAAVRAVQEQQATILQEIEHSYQEEAATLTSKHGILMEEHSSKHNEELERLSQSHSNSMAQLKKDHEQGLSELAAELALAKERIQTAEENARGSEERLTLGETHLESVIKLHSDNVQQLQSRHDEELLKLEAKLRKDHQQALRSLEDSHKNVLQQEQVRLEIALADLRKQHASESESFGKERDMMVQEIEAHKVAADEFTLLRQQSRENHEQELSDKDSIIVSLEQNIASVGGERDELEAEVAKLRAELGRTRNEQSKLIQEASKRESLVLELERHRSVLADLQENLQKVKDEKDVIQSEKTKSDAMIRDLQAQLTARSASPPNVRSPDRGVGFQRGTNLPAIKLPPPTPPPSVPPPPAPRSAVAQNLNGENLSTSSQGSAFNSSVSSRESQPESPSTSVGHIALNGISVVDAKAGQKIEQQAKLLDEQEAMIKTLNKQLMHCETDLQTHMDLVTTLETSLGDSEKNLRKARMQATELARERDTLNVKLETMRNELTEAKREVVTVRRSIVEEKQSLEQRLDEERKAKERARQQLDSRMEELQKRKSKFACL